MNRLRCGPGRLSMGARQKKPDIKDRRRHIFYYYRFAMMNLLGRFKPLTLSTLLLVTACSTVQTGQRQSSVSAANVATVYLYRTHDSPGGAVGVDIKDNGIDLGTLQDGTYFIYHANPGQHVFTALPEVRI
jgi:hypothetical protein